MSADRFQCDRCPTEVPQDQAYYIDGKLVCRACYTHRDRLRDPQPEGNETCPECGSDQIEGGPIDIIGTEAMQPMNCPSCGWHWSDTYAYVEPPEQNIEFVLAFTVRARRVADVGGLEVKDALHGLLTEANNAQIRAMCRPGQLYGPGKK